MLIARQASGQEGWVTHSDADHPRTWSAAFVAGWGQRFFGVLYEHAPQANVAPLHVQVRPAHSSL